MRFLKFFLWTLFYWWFVDFVFTFYLIALLISPSRSFPCFASFYLTIWGSIRPLCSYIRLTSVFWWLSLLEHSGWNRSSLKCQSVSLLRRLGLVLLLIWFLTCNGACCHFISWLLVFVFMSVCFCVLIPYDWFYYSLIYYELELYLALLIYLNWHVLFSWVSVSRPYWFLEVSVS